MATKGPQRDWLTILSSAMLAVPSLLLLWLCLHQWVVMILGWWNTNSISGFAACGLVAFPLPILGVLLGEYLSLIRFRADAARIIGFLCLYLTILSAIPLVIGLFNLLVGWGRNPDSVASWGDSSILLVLFVVFLFIGLGHLRWGRILKAARSINRTDQWAVETD